MALERAISWIATVAAVYAILVATYGATCFAVARLNRQIAAAKIQARETPQHLIRRDQRQSLLSLFAIAAMFGTGHWLYVEFGWGLRPFGGVAGSILAFLGSLILFDTWFYWFHRLIHTPALYPWVHRWHHLTVTPVAWSNNKLYDQVTGVIGHSGWEHGGPWCRPPSPLVSVTHHDQHHRYFRCNYATHFTLWDRLMGTLHPEHDAEARRNIAATAAVRRTARVPAE